MSQRTIIIEDYDPLWPSQFDNWRQLLADTLGELAVSIEHVGSTSVPDLPAKPIFDICVVMQSHAKLPTLVDRLATIGFEHHGDCGVLGREAFRGELSDGSDCTWAARHLYVLASDNEELERMLAFRDYLRVHPQALETYAGIKRDLAERHPHDIKAYTQGKAFFVESCIRAVREAQAPVADAPPGQVGREITAYYGKNREVERLIAGSGQLERVRVQELLRCQLPAPPAVILDVGGGPGTHSTWLAQDGYAVHLIDPMENLLEDACQAFAALSEARRVVRAGGVVIAIGI